jgi:acylglycerol lipase
MLLKQYRRLQQFSLGKNLLALCASVAIMAQCGGVALAQSVPDAAAVSPISSIEVSYEENGSLSEQLNLPVYTWKKPGMAPRGVILAVHGLAMHGKCYEQLGRILADRGYVFVSTDLRGYGSYLNTDHKFCDSAKHSVADCKTRTNYDKSYEDLATLSRKLKERYATVPLFAMGESLGGALVIRLAASHPELVDGLVLSAPALKHHNFIDPYFFADASLCMTNPRHQLDLTPFVRRYSSDDPRIVDEVLADPLARRRLSAFELLQVSKVVHKTVGFVSKITPDTPVLVIQGSADKCVKAQGVMVLLSELRSHDQTVKWFHERGHILIETAYIKNDTRDSVVDWLESHVNCPEVQARCNRAGIMAGIMDGHEVGLTVSAIRVR